MVKLPKSSAFLGLFVLVLLLFIVTTHKLTQAETSVSFTTLQFPVDIGRYGNYGHKFLDESSLNGAPHPGIDLNRVGTSGDQDKGDPVYSVASGVVTYARDGGSGWGNIVLIEHTLPDGSQIWTQYAHLDEIENGITSTDNPNTPNDERLVQKGQQIGTIGDTGIEQNGAHLHWEIRIQNMSATAFPASSETDADVMKRYVNPLTYLQIYEPLDGVKLYRETYLRGNGEDGGVNQLTILTLPQPVLKSVAVPYGWSIFLLKNPSMDSPYLYLEHSDLDLSDDTFSDGSRVQGYVRAVYVNPGVCIGTPLFQGAQLPNAVNLDCSPIETPQPVPTSTEAPAPGPTNTPISIPTPTSPPGIPADAWKVNYFRDIDLQSKCHVEDEWYQGSPYVIWDWGDSEPMSGCHGDNNSYSARFWRHVDFQGGNYDFYLYPDDQARIRVGGQLVVDHWDSSTQHEEGNISIPAGQHEVVVEYRNTGGRGILGAWWSGPGFPAMPHDQRDNNQWYGEYWGNRHQWEAPIYSRNEGNSLPLQKEWGMGGLDYGLPTDYFSTKFSRTYDFSCGDYEFELGADDIADLKVSTADGQQVLSMSVNNRRETRQASELSGNYQVEVTHREESGAAELYIDWHRVKQCATATPVSPTATNTPVPPTATNTRIPPTATNTPIPPTPTLPVGNWVAKYYRGNTCWEGSECSVQEVCQQILSGPELHSIWGTGAPCAGMSADDWVGEYESTIEFANAQYVFWFDHNDGGRIWLNGDLIADNENQSGEWLCPPRRLSGASDLRVLLREVTGTAGAHLTWTTDTSACAPPTATNTPVPPTATNTRIPPTSTNTPVPPPTATNTPDVPNAPSNLAASAVSDTAIRVTWTDNSDNETEFRLSHGQGFLLIPANTTSYVHTGLSPEENRCYQIQARNSSGDSFWTPQACATTQPAPAAPNAPSNINASAVSDTTIRVTWSDNSNNETDFRISHGDGYIIVPANTTSYDHTGLSPEQYKCYQIQARNSSGNSSWTSYSCATTESPPNAYECDSDTVVLWRFDDGSGSTAADACGRRSGTLSSTYSWIGGRYDGAIQFGTIGSPGTMTASGFSRFNNISRFTNEFWINRNCASTNDFIMGKTAPGAESWVIGLSSSKIEAEVYGTSYSTKVNSGEEISCNSWHHVALTYDGTYIRLYVDNVLKSTMPHGGGGIRQTTSPFKIGDSGLVAGIDEVRISDTARTSFPAP